MPWYVFRCENCSEDYVRKLTMDELKNGDEHCPVCDCVMHIVIQPTPRVWKDEFK